MLLALPKQMTLRVVRGSCYVKGFRVRQLTLVTTLLDAERCPAREILQAYLRRWRLEMCLDNLKTTLQMEMLRSRTPGMLQKEVYSHLIAHNLIRCTMAQAAAEHAVPLERISFKGTLDALRQFSEAIAALHPEADPLVKGGSTAAMNEHQGGHLFTGLHLRHSQPGEHTRGFAPKGQPLKSDGLDTVGPGTFQSSPLGRSGQRIQVPRAGREIGLSQGETDCRQEQCDLKHNLASTAARFHIVVSLDSIQVIEFGSGSFKSPPSFPHGHEDWQ